MAMRKYLSKVFAKKLLIIGGILFGVSLIANFATLFSVYGKVGKCLGNPNCSFSTEQIVGKFAMFLSYAGIGVFCAGLMVWIICTLKNKK